MRVGIDVAILSSPATGIGFYTLHLVQALTRVERDIEFVLLGAAPSLLSSIPHGKNFQVHPAARLQGIKRSVWQQTALPWLAASTQIDALHCPDFSRPLFSSVPIVNTIHDLSYFAPQCFFSLSKRMYKRALGYLALKRSDRIIVDSEFTRREVLRRYPIDAQRVTVIHLGVNPVLRAHREKPKHPFLLFLGTLEERKNLVTLVRAFDVVRERDRISHRLVLVGQPGFGWSQIKAAIAGSRYCQDIEVCGYLEREAVEELLQTADLFIYPSVYEGFGLPVLEAMACGTPVVCSRAASLPEVAGDAAEYFEPTSVEDLAAAMEGVLSSTERQAELRRKGLERAKLFSWEECARRTLEVYREVLRK
jgi:glycosyltransferase involved in cell wall biosynthesis